MYKCPICGRLYLHAYQCPRRKCRIAVGSEKPTFPDAKIPPECAGCRGGSRFKTCRRVECPGWSDA